MKYIKSFKESIDQNRLNYLLDKISKDGIDSLSKEERNELDNPSYSKKEVDIDADGDLVSNGEKITKRPASIKWSYHLQDEVMEYLFNNFRRTGDKEYVAKDNLEKDVTINQVIDRVKKFFNCDLKELEIVVNKWASELVTESKEYVNSILSEIILNISRECNIYYSDADYNDNDEMPIHIRQFISIIEKYLSDYQIDNNQYPVTDKDIADLESKLTRADIIQIRKVWNTYNAEINKLPTEKELENYFLIIKDEYDVDIEIIPRYESGYQYIIKFGYPEEIMSSGDGFITIEDSNKLEELIKQINHVVSNIFDDYDDLFFNLFINHQNDTIDIQLYAQ